MTTPEVSVVIVAWRAREDVLRCLDSLERHAGTSYEAIVVDDGSGDGTPAAVADRFPDTKVIVKAQNAGLAAGRNSALAHVRGRHVLMLACSAAPPRDGRSWVSASRRARLPGSHAAPGVELGARGDPRGIVGRWRPAYEHAKDEYRWAATKIEGGSAQMLTLPTAPEAERILRPPGELEAEIRAFLHDQLGRVSPGDDRRGLGG